MMADDWRADPASVVERADSGRFVLDFPGGQAFVSYRPEQGGLYLEHTEVPAGFEGHGIASALVEGVFRLARASGRKITAGCDFAAGWARRHPEWHDTLAG